MLAEMNMAVMLKSMLFVLLPLAGSCLLVFGVWQVFADLKTANAKKLMERLTDRASPSSKKDLAIESLLRKQNDHQAAIDMLLGKISLVPKLQKTLDQANVDWRASRMLIYLTAASVGTLLLLLLFQANVMYTGLITLGVFFLPILHVMHKRRRRINRLIDQLPDVFEMIGQALRAGHSLGSGIGLVSEQLPDPAGTEFARVFHEQNLGVKVEDALVNMADRVDQLDLRFFVTAVLIQRQTGGDLAEVLDKISHVIRDRIQLFGMVQGLTAEGRLSGWVLLALPILVFFMELWINPDYANVLLYDPMGKMMLFGTVCMMLMGMALIKKIVNIKV
jgi:tight adherence protein B